MTTNYVKNESLGALFLGLLFLFLAIIMYKVIRSEKNEIFFTIRSSRIYMGLFILLIIGSIVGTIILSLKSTNVM